MKISNKQYFIIKLLNSSLRPQSDISGLILSESLCWSHLTEHLFNVLFFDRSPVSNIQILMPFLWSSTKVTVDQKIALNCCLRVTSTNPFQLWERSVVAVYNIHRKLWVSLCVCVRLFWQKCLWVMRRKSTFFSSELIIHNQSSCEGENMKCAKTRAYCLLIVDRTSGSCVALTGSLAEK